MQLSAPTTSNNDPQLAAFLAATGRACPLDGVPVAPDGTGAPAAFAQMLTGAPAGLTPTAGAQPETAAASAPVAMNLFSGIFSAASLETPRSAPTLASAEIRQVFTVPQTTSGQPTAATAANPGAFFPAWKFDPKAPASQPTVNLAGALPPSSEIPASVPSAAAASTTNSLVELPRRNSGDDSTLPAAAQPGGEPSRVALIPLATSTTGLRVATRLPAVDTSRCDTDGAIASAPAGAGSIVSPRQVGQAPGSAPAAKISTPRAGEKKTVAPAPVAGSGTPLATIAAAPTSSVVVRESVAPTGSDGVDEDKQKTSAAPRRPRATPAENFLSPSGAIAAVQAATVPASDRTENTMMGDAPTSEFPVGPAAVSEKNRALPAKATPPIPPPAIEAKFEATVAAPDTTPVSTPLDGTDRALASAPTAAWSVSASANPAATAMIGEAIAADAPAKAEALADAGSENIPAGSPRIMRFENSIPSRAEIFAALDQNFTAVKKSAPSASDKTFLNAVSKRVATQAPDLGIGVAKSESVMPTATFSDRAPTAAPLERVAAAPAAAVSQSPVTMMASEPGAVAHRAVEAVMTAVERFSSSDRHAVQLQFSVGGADLAVRVELRGDEVRTTFRTDSPELRSALAHEWQAATPDSADRSVRIAAPVFSSSDTANFSAFSGDTASRQGNARARRAEAEDVFSAVAARGAVSTTGTIDAAAAVSRATSTTALHLSTLA